MLNEIEIKPMTKKEFIAYWLKPDESGLCMLDYCQENLGEMQTQYASECAMFGDAGPGQGLAIRNMRSELVGATKRLREFGLRI